MKNSIVTLSLVFMSAAALALPTFLQVETEVRQGHYAQAETMLAEVVEARPRSAKAHYVYAEILAHNAKFAKASLEAKTAREIDPAIKFTQPDKFRDFEQMLASELSPPVVKSRSMPALTAAPTSMVAPRVPEATGIPGWAWGGMLALIGVFLWRGFTRSRATPAATYGATGMPVATAGQGFGASGMSAVSPGLGAQFSQPGVTPGNGLLGTGLAVAGGVAAGMLVDRMIHSNHGDSVTSNNVQTGLQSGSFDTQPLTSADQAAQDLQNRPVDFGNGNDWDSNTEGSADASDVSWD